MQNGDMLDLRNMLVRTQWNRSAATLGHCLQIGTLDGNAIISVTPMGVAGSACYAVPTLYGFGSGSLATLISHSVV